MPKRRIAEASACVKKYFKAASVENWLFLLDIRGMKDKRLISSPIQAPSQVEAEIVISVPIIRVE
jgi:hypothetical protein